MFDKEINRQWNAKKRKIWRFAVAPMRVVPSKGFAVTASVLISSQKSYPAAVSHPMPNAHMIAVFGPLPGPGNYSSSTTAAIPAVRMVSIRERNLRIIFIAAGGGAQAEGDDSDLPAGKFIPSTSYQSRKAIF